MAASVNGAKSLKEYLKRYESNTEDEKKSKKKKRKKSKPDAAGVLVVDEDPVWQKAVNLEEDNAGDSADEEKPQIDEDIEVKRMKRLEQLKARRPYNAISEDGSGWVPLSPKRASSSFPEADMSPPRKLRARNDTPSPEPELKPSDSGRRDDLSPPRQRRNLRRTQSPEPDEVPPQSNHPSSDISPPRKHRALNDTPSPASELKHSGNEDDDLSPPRQRRRRHHTPPEATRKNVSFVHKSLDISVRRAHRPTSNVSERTTQSPDISLPRSGNRGSQYQDDNIHVSRGSDLSPPRKSRKDGRRPKSLQLPPLHSDGSTNKTNASHISLALDLSPPRRNHKEPAFPISLKDEQKTGLITGRDISEEIAKTKKDDWLRFKEMDPSISGRGAQPVYRDKIKGERISKEEFHKSRQKAEDKPMEKTLEWGKGLAQKREAEARLQELEIEKDRPFARTRDDPELDEMLKERVRWGDPMAHLVKKKHHVPVLPNLGDGERMKDSGFVIPQDIPAHSWFKRGLDAAPNRYGIRPGRHWDGVDRSNGSEKELFKRMNEKQATQKEAYLWSVSDM